MSHFHPSEKTCLNCGYTWPEGPKPYCPDCGQENRTLRMPLREWIMEFIEGILHVDGKFWITLKDLAFKPGKASAEYVAGRRARYMPPVRLYLFVSFVFFLLMSLTYTDITDVPGEKELDERWSSVQVNVLGDNALAFDNLTSTRREVREAYRRGPEAVDSLLAVNGFTDLGFMERGFWHQAAKIETLGPELFQQRMRKTFTLDAFLLMPFYALLLRWFFRRNNLYYSEHLVFSIHAHTLLFLMMSLFFVFGLLDLTWPAIGVLIALAIMHGASLKRFYQQGTGLTIVKYLGLTLLYFTALQLVLLLGMVISFATI